jgi:hypothetical protein
MNLSTIWTARTEDVQTHLYDSLRLHRSPTDHERVWYAVHWTFGPAYDNRCTPISGETKSPSPATSRRHLAQLRSAENATTTLNKAIHKQSLICPSIARPMTSMSSLCRGRFSLRNIVSHDCGVYRNHRVLVEIPWFNTMISAWFNIIIGIWFHTVI